MKYTCEIEINKPLEEVVTLFDNTDNLFKWQKGLIEYTTLRGNTGEEGSEAKMVFDMGNRKMVMIQTVTHKNLPEAFHGAYVANGVHNFQYNNFDAVNATTTRWRSKNEFKFKGLLKLIFPFMKNMFKKQSMTYLENFKVFAETGKSVN